MDILEFTARNGGVVSLRHLHAAGFSSPDVSRTVSRGSLHRVVRGWVAVDGAPPLALRAIRAGGRVSCLDVLRAHRIWSVNDRLPHVRVGRHSGHSPSAADGRRSKTPIVVHRSLRSQPLGDRAVDPLPVALAHAVLCQPWMDAVASLDSAMNRGYLSFVQVAELLDPLPASSRRLLDLIDPTCESGLETKARLSLKAVNIPYRTQVEIPMAGRVDILIGDRLVLELDGWEWHSDKVDFERDRRKDLALHSLQYQVLRLSHAQVSSGWSEALGVIRAKVSRGEHRWSERQRRTRFAV
ncbi:type IV toxin-antitoxin system AbiEi family antitoxin domain-containing protein [Herbiconiux ginsengi]|uniref:DUF559 domain-containing protein n=1 Tax=Herbiconiux ginsengi TaxID=381665 RepID=A0A1H3RQ13_9MICO|nr:type IV toxin-antitoxin system AbiEi family antitoxin domain-containing protein [Herbiconiux ginsengi]SDZ27301.1 hypothetical protein SAMN05216554_2954 [Herbiconiux ginsengi]